MKKSSFVLITFITVLCGVFSIPYTPNANGGEWIKNKRYTLRLGHCLSERFSYHLGAMRFAELVQIYSRGEAEIKVYPNFQLGSEEEQIKAVQLGIQDMTLIAINNATPWYPPLDIFMMPYIFRDREHAFKVADGPIGQKMKEGLIKAGGIRILSLIEYGWRCVGNNVRPIRKVEDLQGILIRTPHNPVMIDTFNALGSEATAVAWGEVFNALQQGVVDGFEATPNAITDLRFNEVIKFFSMTNHFYGFAAIVINEKKFQSLPRPIQGAILQAAKESEAYERWVSIMQHRTAADDMRKAGVKVNYIEDLGLFREKVKPVWKKYESKIGKDWFDAVLSVE